MRRASCCIRLAGPARDAARGRRAAPGDGSAADTQQSHDEECGLCRGGGELLCCDGCSAAFHLACLGLAAVPAGDWLCAVCADSP